MALVKAILEWVDFDFIGIGSSLLGEKLAVLVLFVFELGFLKAF